MKRFISGFICGGLLFCLLGAGASGVWDNIPVLRNDINVIVDGTEIQSDNFLYNDTTYLPLRAVSEALNKKVEYDELNNTAYIGERKGDVMKSKYTPPEDLKNFIFIENNIYYIEAGYILSLAEKIGLKTNLKDLNANGNEDTTLIINGRSWNMVFLSNGWRYIPYDTYIDEILPLLK